MAKKPVTEFEKARDAYGNLTKDQRNKVLDIVSQKTDLLIGPEAEQIFIDAVHQVQNEAYNQYCMFGV